MVSSGGVSSYLANTWVGARVRVRESVSVRARVRVRMRASWLCLVFPRTRHLRLERREVEVATG